MPTKGTEKTIVPAPTPVENVLWVGVTPDAPPLIFKQGGRMVGLVAELATALAKELNKSVRFLELEWNDLIPALLENRIDIIMSGMTITAMRQVRIAFTSPYLKTGQTVLAHGEDLAQYSSAASIKKTNRRVGFVKGTTGDFIVQQELPLASQKSPYPSAEKGVQALVEGRIDFFIYDAPVAWLITSEREADGVVPLPVLLTEEYLAWGVRKNDTQLLQHANRLLETWESDGRLQKVIKHWIPYAPDERIP